MGIMVLVFFVMVAVAVCVWPTKRYGTPVAQRTTFTTTIGGGELGWSTCYCCHGSWDHLQGHTTNYSDTGGCFPLCEGCWMMLGTPEARLPYYKMLWDEWERQLPGHNPISKWDQIESAVQHGG